MIMDNIDIMGDFVQTNESNTIKIIDPKDKQISELTKRAEIAEMALSLNKNELQEYYPRNKDGYVMLLVGEIELMAWKYAIAEHIYESEQEAKAKLKERIYIQGE
jgi:hypothetical protein